MQRKLLLTIIKTTYHPLVPIMNVEKLNYHIYKACGVERKHLALRPQKPLRLIRDGEVGGSGILHLTPTRYTVTTRMILH